MTVDTQKVLAQVESAEAASGIMVVSAAEILALTERNFTPNKTLWAKNLVKISKAAAEDHLHNVRLGFGYANLKANHAEAQWTQRRLDEQGFETELVSNDYIYLTVSWRHAERT